MCEIIEKNGNIILHNLQSFNLAQTLDCGQAFRFCESDGVWSAVVFGKKIDIAQIGEDIIIYNMKKAEFMENFYGYFTLDIDYDLIKSQLSADENLKSAIDYCGGIRLLRQDKWECLCSFIISQNNNIPRIKGIIERLCENFGEKTKGGYTFPSYEKIATLTVEDLSVLRAGFRAKYIIDASKKCANGEIDFDLLDTAPLDTAREELKKIKGLGNKVADCVLLFSCSRFDAFPRDVWINRVVSELYPNGLPECFGTYGGIAQQYLFHWRRNLENS